MREFGIHLPSMNSLSEQAASEQAASEQAKTRAHTVRVAAAQFAAGTDVDHNIAQIEALAAEAAARDASVVVFPEASMYAVDASGDALRSAAQQFSAHFRSRLCEIAGSHGIHIVAGAFVPGSGARPFNRLLIAGPDGVEQPGYDKLHLYDAFSWRESDNVEPGPVIADGSELRTVRVGAFTLGLMNCYDLRFPEMARKLVDLGANVLVVSSAWIAGPLKEMHWETLLRARAIENTCYVVASGQSPPASVGLSMIVDPAGVVASTCIGDTGLASAELSIARLDEVRSILPSLQHRRY